MYQNDNYYEQGNIPTNYGAAPDRNPDAEIPNQAKQPKKSHPFMKKLGLMFVGGVTFGLAAALIFVAVLKASGMDKALEALKDADVVTIEETTIGSQNQEAEDGAVTEDQNKTQDADTQDRGVFGTKVSNKAAAEYSVSEIADSCMPSIVSITNKGVEEVRSMFGTRQYQSTSVGSGIIIGQNDTELLIATNNHVVANANELSVCFGDDEDKVAEARIKGTDAGNDLAILAVSKDELTNEIKTMISVAKIGNSADVKVGDQVVAIGNSLGYGQSVTTGIVSAKDREVTIEGMTAKLIQTDAAINPGNSGGALLNMKGELIGINSSKFASAVVEGMGYAIPIDTAEPILEGLMNRQTRDMVDESEQGYMGVSCQNVSSEIAEMYNIPKGVYILEAVKNGAAERAGIQKGDIITKFDGITISDYDDLKNNLQYYKAGETIDVTLQRAKENGGYEEKTIAVTLDSQDRGGYQNSQSPLDERGENPADDTENNPDGNSGWRSYSPEDFFRDFFDY